MFKKFALATAVVAFSSLALAAPSAVQAKTVLKIGGVHSPQSFETKGLQRFAELVAEKTGGNVEVKVYPAGQLGDAVTMIENVMIGAQDMFANVADWNQHLVKDYGIMAMPFAFSGADHVQRFLDSDTFSAMKLRMIDEKGVRVLADNWYRLPRVLVTKQPVKSLADLENRKLRMANIDAYLKTWAAFGAKPTVIPWSESYLALKTGIVVGMDSPLASIYPQKFFEAAPYVTMTNHSVAPFNILISERSYQKLSPAQQQALVAAAREAGDAYTKAIVDDFSKQKAEMEKAGVKFSEVDLGPFVSRAAVIAREFEQQGQWTAGLFDKVQTLN